MVTVGDKIIVVFEREQILQSSYTQILLWRWVDFLFFPFKVYIFKKTWKLVLSTLTDLIESVQKRALKVIFSSLSYEDQALKILLCQRRGYACITFLKQSYSSSHLLGKLVLALTRPYARRTGETDFVPASPRSNRFRNFCTFKTRITFKAPNCDLP